MFRSLRAIAGNSFAEITRQPVYGILLLSGMALIALSPIITMFAMGGPAQLLTDMGLGTIFMMGLVLAVLSATQVISREIDARTAGAVLSKPVGRFVFVVGKFVGVSLAMAVATYLFTLVLLMTVRMGVPATANYRMDWPVFLGEVIPFAGAMGLALYANFFHRSNFTSTAVIFALPLYTLSFIALCMVSKQWRFDSGAAFWIANTFIKNDGIQIFLAAVLVFLGVWVTAAVAVAASTRVNVVVNVMICAGLVFVGLVSQYLFGWAVGHPTVGWVAREGGAMVEVSGHVRSVSGQAIAGATIQGLPGRPVTDPTGFYEVRVRQGGWGTAQPQMRGYAFKPPSRDYASVVADRAKQDYVAIRHEPGPMGHVRNAWKGLCWLAYHVVPSFQFFWAADQLMRPDPFIPPGYVLLTAVYAAAWCAAMVTLGAFLFERREVI